MYHGCIIILAKLEDCLARRGFDAAEMYDFAIVTFGRLVRVHVSHVERLVVEYLSRQPVKGWPSRRRTKQTMEYCQRREFPSTGCTLVHVHSFVMMTQITWGRAAAPTFDEMLK